MPAWQPLDGTRAFVWNAWLAVLGIVCAVLLAKAGGVLIGLGASTP